MSSSCQLSSTGIVYRKSPNVEGAMKKSKLELEVSGGLAHGVRGLSGAITMERSEDEKSKFPDRINLDRKGLHGIPILEGEPGLRLLSMQHNYIKRIQHLDSTYRLVFLDLYHNRLDVISNLEPLINLRVLMLGKNRIRRMEGLQKCNRLSVLDLHGNRITQISGLDNLCELKVLNLAGNLIRKLSNLESLSVLEELNVRRNRIRTTNGLEHIASLEKLYMSNNEIQNIGSLQKLEGLVKLHTVQMEGNPVWSSSEYAYHLVTSLTGLQILDQQEISMEIRASAMKWKQTQNQFSSASGSVTGARKQLLKKMEERNVSISNAKRRWDFLKKQDWKHPESSNAQQEAGQTQNFKSMMMMTRKRNDGEEDIDDETSSMCLTATSATEMDSNMSTSLSSTHLALSRQASKSSLLGGGKLNIPLANAILTERPRSSPGSPIQGVGRSSSSSQVASVNRFLSSESTGNLRHHSAGFFPPISMRSEHMKKKFPGLERRRFAMPLKFASLQSQLGAENGEVLLFAGPGSGSGTSKTAQSFATLDKKIGFFNTPNQDENHSTGDELSNAGILSDSSSETSSSDTEDNQLALPTQPITTRKTHSVADMDKLRRNTSTPKLHRIDQSASGLDKPVVWNKLKHTTPSKQAGSTSSVSHAETGRTCEQGRDFLIELDGDLLSVYGLQSLKFLDRPWNRNRAVKATTVQFNFVSFDDLIPYLSKFRQTFPNVENFEFLETDINCLGQLNALALLQGITSVFIGEDGNPIYHKNWKSYAIYRLEHWGLQYINNFEFTEEDILEANNTYGALGELAIMVLPQSQISAMIRKLDLAFCVKDSNPSETTAVNLIGSIRDPFLKEIIAKEALQYKPKTSTDLEHEKKNFKAAELLLENGHASFHKIGRLEDEWGTILPIVVSRIMAQYSDIRRYKKESLVKLERKERTPCP